jgi:hypothetical protein
VDGFRVYPEPPRRVRRIDRIDRLLDRVTPAMWLLVLLALAETATAFVDALATTGGSGPVATVLGLESRLGYTLCLTLLPAGVLIWRPDAWRSAPLVLGGALVWTTLPAVVGIAWWIVRRSPGLMDEFGAACAVAVSTVVIVSCAGPAIVALGLERTRKQRTKWLRPLALRAAALDQIRLARFASGAVLPIETLGLLLLACSCASAVSGGEPQRRLWQFGAAGATVLAILTIDEMAFAVLPGVPGTGDLAGAGWPAVWAAAILLIGSGLMLLAFASPLWSTARDAVRAGGTAPEEVFAWGPDAGVEFGEPLPMSAVVAVAAGKDHSLALDSDGRVGAWGDDTLGQTEVPAGLSEVIAVAAGDGFSMALRIDGTVVAWGANDRGQTAVPRDLSGVVAIAAGSDFALALKSDGTVVGWGDSDCEAIPVPPGLAGMTAISAGEYHALALRRDGTVVAWGDDTYGQSSLPARRIRATAISAGGGFSLALLTDGTVVAWGDDSYGQLDVPAGLANVASISAGVFHALALRADGDVVGWGGGSRQGESDHPWRLVDFKAVAAGDGFSLAIRAA